MGSTGHLVTHPLWILGMLYRVGPGNIPTDVRMQVYPRRPLLFSSSSHIPSITLDHKVCLHLNH